MKPKTKQKTLIAYHFTSDTLRDGSPIPKRGVWLKHKGPVVPCQSGLHASVHPFDALRYAPGGKLHLVELRGEIQKHGDDKVVARERKILKSVNAEKLLREFARWNALQVLNSWPNPPDVVVEYLKTGDEKLRAAAESAAWSAAESAARSAAESAAWSAAESAAWSAAWSAAESAAESAAWSAAESAAWLAARSAAESAARKKLATMLRKAFV